MTSDQKLRAIKSIHTMVWVFFVVCIAGIPIFAWRGEFRAVFWMIVIVIAEVAVLALNRMRCPLTDIAARYTNDRSDNFDIYLPLIVARYNKHIFGPLFLFGTIYAVCRWIGLF